MTSDHEPKSAMTLNVADQIPAACTILAIIGIIGSLGNLLVLYVYGMKNDRQTATLFIIVLAAADCTACLVIIPLTIAIEQFEWKLTIYVCKAYYVFNSTGITFSSLLISAIALDRYLCICHPFLQLMTIRRAKIFIGGLASFSLMIGVMSTFQIRSKMNTYTHTLPDNTTEIRHEEECFEVTRDNHTTTYETIFYHVAQKSQTADFLLCILSVITLYVLIFRSVLRMRRKREELKGLRIKKKPLPNPPELKSNKMHLACTIQLIESNHKDVSTCVVSMDPNSENGTKHEVSFAPSTTTSNLLTLPSKNGGSSEPIGAPEESKLSLDLPDGDSPTTVTSRKHSNKNLRDNHVLQNLKTAAMLFVVAIVYIITFVPASLMANQYITLYLPVFYLYYINSAANPIIYCFMNQNFRDDINKLFCPNRGF